METNKEEIGDLKDFLGPQKLTPEVANSKELAYECIDMTQKKYEDQTSPVLKLTFQREDNEYTLSLNKTNLDILGDYMEQFDFKKLTEFINCAFYFDIRKVTNPVSGKLQDSLFISNITNE